jgi:hypothetical protein
MNKEPLEKDESLSTLPSKKPLVSLQTFGTKAVRVMVGLVALWAAVSSIAGAPSRRWNDPEPSLSVSRSSVATRTIDDQRDRGIRFTKRQEHALRQLIGLWERRQDVRTLFSTPKGEPDVVNLLRWAKQNNDPDALQLAMIRPALDEASARMGILGADGDVIAVFVQSVAMRPEPRFVVGGALWDLAQVWNRRPDLRKRFTDNGVVNVRGIFTWAATVPRTDPDFDTLKATAGNFDQVLAELPPIRHISG